MHGVSLSIGSTDPLNRDYLRQLKELAEHVEPAWISDHLCWTGSAHASAYDLLPLPYTDETAAHTARRVRRLQKLVRRPVAIENTSSYATWKASTMTEWAFLNTVLEQADCALLLDVNNVFVSATNHRTDPRAYFADFPLSAVGEIHLAGHEAEDLPDGPLLIDSHSRPVADPVWALFSDLITGTGPLPTLIEWDNDVPGFEVLMAEAARAEALLEGVRRAA